MELKAQEVRRSTLRETPAMLTAGAALVDPRRNRFRISLAIWVFILCVTVADTSFFWLGCDSAGDWELNPMALLALRWTGVAGVVLYRASWFCFAWLMARTRTRLSWLITPVWGTSHLFLLVILLQAFPGLSH
jgi:hypothetical protein